MYGILAAHSGKTERGYLYESVWTEYAQNLFNGLFLYGAIALAVILLGVGVLVYYRRRESLNAYIKGAICVFFGFALAVILIMFALAFAKIDEKGYAEYPKILTLVLVPAAVLGGVAVLGVASTYISGLFSKKVFKITSLTSLALFGAAFIAFFVCLSVYFSLGAAEDNNGITVSLGENVGLYLCALGLIAAIVLIAVFFGGGEKRGFDSKAIAYAAVCAALSFALSYVKIIRLPQGGSVTIASMMPLMLYSYMFGIRRGVICGAVYGVLQAMQDPFLIHPAQFLLDYPVAFSAMGVAGFASRFKKLEKFPQLKFALGGVAAATLRFIAHVLSGVFAFSEYSTLDNVWAYSLAYNSFVFVDMAICVALGIAVLSVKPFVNRVEGIRLNNSKKAVPAPAPVPAATTEPTSEPAPESTTEPKTISTTAPAPQKDGESSSTVSVKDEAER